MWSHEKTLAASSRTSSLSNQERDSNRYPEQKTVLGLASANLWCKHFCSSQAKMCLLRSALSSALGVPLQDGKTHPGHLPKSSCFSGRQGLVLGSPSLPQEGSGKSAQQPSTSRCALLVWPFKLHYTIAEVCRKAAETRLAWKNVLAKVWNNPPILNLLGVHTAVVCQDSRRIRVASVRQGNQRECCKQGLHTGNLEETIQREDRAFSGLMLFVLQWVGCSCPFPYLSHVLEFYIHSPDSHICPGAFSFRGSGFTEQPRNRRMPGLPHHGRTTCWMMTYPPMEKRLTPGWQDDGLGQEGSVHQMSF